MPADREPGREIFFLYINVGRQVFQRRVTPNVTVTGINKVIKRR